MASVAAFVPGAVLLGDAAQRVGPRRHAGARQRLADAAIGRGMPDGGVAGQGLGVVDAAGGGAAP
jgi:hypothetical protein